MPTINDILIASFGIAQVLWFFAFGASAGSLINVLVYRLPLGLSVVTPPSRCPSCQTQLTWRENIPVLGWLMLGGRCRFCKSRISPEYPLVEAFVGVLFAGLYVLYYLTPPEARYLGIAFGKVAPAWAGPGYGFASPLLETWPTFGLILLLMGSLVAMTLVDAKTFTIPLILTWIPVVVAFLVHPVHALVIERMRGGLSHTAAGWVWTIPTPGPNSWYWVGAAGGGLLGLGFSLLLLRFGFITRSFADYGDWEKSAREATEAGSELSDPEMWTRYPYARREMVKELAFLALPVALAFAGGWVADRVIGATAGWSFDQQTQGMVTSLHVPLWLSALAGSVLGYLVGGGIVWAIRVFGSLGFGKEAMGLGDVHLLAAVGACVGWIDAFVAFFLAAFVGVAWALLGAVFGGLRRHLPYGPHLAVATLLTLLLRPLIQTGLSFLLHTPIELP